MNMIKVESLNKNIKGKAILKDISFEVAEGECVAFDWAQWCWEDHNSWTVCLEINWSQAVKVSIQGLSVTSLS